MRTLRATSAAAVAVGMLVILAPPGSAEPPPAPASGDRTDVFREAQRRPPSRLWYRIHVRFTGMRDRQASGPNGMTRIETESGYRLKANAATLVSVSCGSARVAARNRSCAEVRREIRRRFRGARRQRLLRGLRESYSFRANMTGAIDGSVRTTVDPITATGPTGEKVACSPSAQITTRIRAARQRARGVVSSRAGSSAGVIVQAMPVGSSFAGFFVSPVTCPTFKDSPPTFAAGGESGIQDFTWQALDRGLLSFINGTEQSEHLAFDRPPGRFGRTFSLRKVIRENGGRLNPAGLLDTADKARRHDYTLIFRVCARGGRLPRGC
ncbi:MAG: hypothetical protein ACR2N6_07310 [Miltoncostaeaceae bacterium]